MANVRKKISQLTALASASLNTTIVGVDGGTTYKIELDTLADAVSSRVNILDRDRLASLESVTSSFESKGRNIISGSSQLISSFDQRYVVSGSITQTTWDNIANKPSGIVSQSTDLSLLNEFTSSQSALNTAFTNGISGRLTTSSFNSFTASISTASLVDRLNELEFSSSKATASITELYDNAFISTQKFNLIDSVSGSWITESETGSFLTSLNGAISSSSQLTSSYDTRYTLSGSVQPLPLNLISSSTQISDFGFISSSHTDITSLNSFTSSQSTLNTAFNNGIGARLQTSSFNEFSASMDGRFNGLVTTGSNTFSGSQIFSGSMTVTSGQIVASLITANTSSLYLTSGSNMYVQNNGVVEITGSLKVKGTARFETVGGDEGGEIEFGVPQTNTTLSTSVKADIYQNRLRIFDGNTNGVFIDLSKAPIGVAGELTWKASGYVNAGTFVQLDNLKVTVTTSGNRGASIGAVSTSFTANIGASFTNSAGIGGSMAANVSYTTTASASAFGWNFGAAGDTATYILNDTTNSRTYRVIVMIGSSYNNNFISIERLH